MASESEQVEESKMETGLAEISGVGPRRSNVQVLDQEGNVIAETVSNSFGNWRIAALAMPVGTHVVRARMWNANGQEILSPEISVTVGGPEDQIEINAEPIDAEAAAILEEINREEQEVETIRAAMSCYDEMVERAATDVGSTDEWKLSQVLSALQESRDKFFSDVYVLRGKRSYARFLLEVAAAEKITREHQGTAYHQHKKGADDLAADVGILHRIAMGRWRDPRIEDVGDELD